VLLAQPVMQAVFSPVAGKLSDRMQPRLLASIGIALTLVGVLLLLNATEGTALLPLL